MSLSTTSTAVYILSKYSRAHQLATVSGTQDENAEWQHFTNPIIRLVLDIKKSGDGELESYRVRVLWSINSARGPDAMDVDQQEVCFEDLDLLAFSSEPLQAQKQSMAVHGLPLRAVYREGVVGIRYQHPRVVPVGGTPNYRRLQMNFQTPTDALDFVDAIRLVCPCKANPPPQPGLARTNTMAINPRHTGPTTLSGVSNVPPPRLLATAAPSLRPAATMQAPSVVSDKRVHPNPGVEPALRTSTTMLPPSEPRSALRASTTMLPSAGGTQYTRPQINSQPCTTAGSVVSPRNIVPMPVSLPLASGPHILSASARPSSASASASATSLVPVSSVSSSSSSSELQPTSSSTPSPNSGRKHLFVAEPEVIVPTQVASLSVAANEPPRHAPMDVDAVPEAASSVLPETTTTGHQEKPDPSVMASLLKLPSLYELSRHDLEALVAEVIREEGFVKLLEDLDSMWRVKALLG